MSQAATQVNIISPLTGIMVPIGDVPDPVFAKKMVGDGFSIDPLSNTLLAPIDGQIADLQAARHALTIRSADGLEVLIHIGLETVALGGKGFTAHVAPGDAVKVGDELITFDIDQVACDAKSLLTQVVITNGELVESITPTHGLKHAGEDVAATVVLKKAVGQAEQGGGESATVTSEAVALPNPTGMHARPAATLVALAKKYSSNVKLVSGDMSANAKSIVAIMGLGLAHGQDVAISATGADARTAAADLIQAIKDGLGEEAEPVAVAPAPEPPAAPKPEPAKPAAPPRSGDPNTLLGISASPGLAAGTVVQLRTQEFTIAELGQNAADERRTLRDAVDRAMWSLGELRDGLEKEGNSEKAGIFGAHQEILQDPELLERADAEIDGGKSAAFAWRKAYTDLAEQLASLDNEVLAGRATDVRDVGTRVLGEITGQLVEKPDLDKNTILVAKELTPSDTAQIDRAKVIGFATVNGGVSSHVAIIARSMDIPALVGIEERALDIADGTRVVLDSSKGELRLNLSDAELRAVRERQRKQAERKAREEAAKDDPAVTSDGHRVAVVANIGGVDDAKDAAGKGAEGVGLLRSEFVFLGRTTAPSEDEQADVYSQCAKALRPGQPLVIRTLDVGGDKPLPYLPIPAEENPFLGLRGVRVGLDQPETLRTQIRAILASAGAGAKLHVMFPMISTVTDWRRAKEIFDEEASAVAFSGEVSVGIMMEVPTVGIMAGQFAAEPGCDFFSVGTNDLTAYTLAMDRGNANLASQMDPCNPAVLSLIGRAADALHANGKWLGVCGGAASDLQAVPILVGLGVDELSCSIPAIPAVKAMVRSYALSACQELASKAVACSTPEEVRALVPVDEI